jgi:RecA-family ATPase
LLAGRPKLGKSLLSIWIAAQLSRGLLEGSYDEPARSLIIAAEDPPDPIVKGRLIAASADQDLVGTLVTKSDQDHQWPSRSS